MITHFKIFISTILLLFATNQITAQDATKAHKDSLKIVVKKYYDLNLKTFQVNSTIKDIDRIFELFTDDFTYVHPKYGGTYTREDLYNGYVRNQKNGGYDGKVTDIKILNKIVGLNAVVVQRIYVEKKGDGIKEGEPQMTFFEFKKGKISRIFEYW
ncbi:nuclear transport factor 2 family protein [Kordia sp.]|uniref:nuclear transport factor 2 family protein n=1 Tax=Kordia sp. TaxID=1965332 RepID=UPI003D2D746B